jgi:hypothetical protein
MAKIREQYSPTHQTTRAQLRTFFHIVVLVIGFLCVLFLEIPIGWPFISFALVLANTDQLGWPWWLVMVFGYALLLSAIAAVPLTITLCFLTVSVGVTRAPWTRQDRFLLRVAALFITVCIEFLVRKPGFVYQWGVWSGQFLPSVKVFLP